MIDTQTLDFGILLLAGLFLLVGLILFFRGLVGRDPASLYGVQRQVARRAAFVRLLQGGGLVGVAALLFFAYLGFQGRAASLPNDQDERNVMAETAIATTLPEEVVRTIPLEQPTLSATQEITLPVVTILSPTETPPPPPTEIPVEEPPTPEPTLEPTVIPTEAPPLFDATVRVIGGLNLRDAPNGNLIVRLEDGENVNLLAGREAAGAYMWQQIETLDGSVSGWVVEEFLELAE